MTTEEKPDRLGDFLIHQDAQRQANVAGTSNLEAVMARISAEMTAQAAFQKSEADKPKYQCDVCKDEGLIEVRINGVVCCPWCGDGQHRQASDEGESNRGDR